MATTADFRNGLCIELNGDLFVITEFLHVKPGKGPAFVRTKLKNLKTGRTIDNTFTAGVKIDIARVERRPYQFLYKEGESSYNFMHMETYEQIMITEDLISNPGLLKEGQSVEVMYHADTDTPLSCELPAYVDLEVTYTEPGVKGDTATNAQKRAVVETGAEVFVPLFIETGERIKVDTRTNKYSERVK
ncbi:MAG TPA: elongation factor P [Bacteroidales bacterium]|nr:elongation factor P [Bacteroidales bacterium]HOH22941.1 elongation factor P [Bacteroidales bacterium]HPB58323.1 elongation factor P [Bacteroidales bacterium]HPZ02948.1 elongation factor P [Bacteroidales bacterium]HQB74170.1 elongation factor P [Bacteroidales bacterium]